MIKAAGIKIDAFWPTLFAKTFKSKNINDYLVSVGKGDICTAPAKIEEEKKEN